jgi:cytoskeletal protein RodZ
MKVLNVSLVVLIVFAVIFWGFFYYSVRIARETTSESQTTSTTNSASTEQPLSEINSPTTTPVNYHGPTEAPHMIGPSAPPPHY